jgi:DNA-binding NtrC family response regulator
MLKVYDLIEAVAESRTTVLITGESGTGKSLVARAIHQTSSRNKGPFEDIAMGAMSEGLLERELLGYVKGAFNGAHSDRKGRLASASGGTLLIEQMDAASPEIQHTLMQVLQDKRFYPVGSAQPRSADARIILTSDDDLALRVKDGRFREDLYYRIKVVHIELPALRERRGDVALLAEHFVEQHCEQLGRDRRLSNEALELLKQHDWPGNVRELEHAIEHAVVISRQYTISPEDLPESIRPARDRSALSGNDPSRPTDLSLIPALANGWTPMPLTQALLEPERRILLAALEANGWNRNKTARQLDINRTTLYKKIRHFQLEPQA